MIDVNRPELGKIYRTSQNNDLQFDKGENDFKVWKLQRKSIDRYKTLLEFGLSHDMKNNASSSICIILDITLLLIQLLLNMTEPLAWVKWISLRILFF